MLENNLQTIFNLIKDGNNLGEPITLVAATKTVPVDVINRSIELGVKVVGDNKVQEFNEKSPFIKNASFHFIGHLQKNKVKYLVGKVDLIHSVDSISLAEEIDRISDKKGVCTNILLEVNIGKEESKSGFSEDELIPAFNEIQKLKSVNVLGLMAMLPKTDDLELKKNLCLQMRSLYDTINEKHKLTYLSLGMSEDYLVAIQNGSNMIRLGSSIYGKRNY
ncbi:MAG: YggS family pyridoxal phosphate-dependent enzyme [Clostridiales bacterium]|nr:YggS family pyridoxal phosphate-dependent enzyme [Clostridiales bacterium]